MGVSKTIQKYGDDLAKPRPEHKAVEDLTKKEAYGLEVLLRTRQWENLTKGWKIFLVLTTAGMYFSNVIFVSLADSGLNGGVFSTDNSKGIVIYPIGHGASTLFTGSLVAHIAFVKVMANKAKEQLKAEASASDVSHLSGPVPSTSSKRAAGAGVDLAT